MTIPKNTLPSLFTANILLLIILTITLIGNHLLNITYINSFYYKVLISQYLLSLLPVLLYLVLSNYNLKFVLKLNKISYKQIIIILFIAISVVFIATFLNNVMVFILSLFGNFTRASQNIPISSSISQLILILLVTALTPAICEETLFRGLIMSCYQEIGIKKAIIISGIFFGIFHFSVNIQGFWGLSFIGIIFAYLVFKTNSLFASILAHFIYNSFGAIIKHITSFSSDNVIQIITPQTIEPQIFASAIFAFPSAILLFVLLKLLSKSSSINIHSSNTFQDKKHINNRFIKYAPLLPILLLYAYSCLKTL